MDSARRALLTAAVGFTLLRFASGVEHSATSATGSAFEPTAHRAVQAAAWRALAML